MQCSEEGKHCKKNFLVQETLIGRSVPMKRNIVNKNRFCSGYIDWTQCSEEAKHCQIKLSGLGYIDWTKCSEDTLIGRSVSKRRNIVKKKLPRFRIHRLDAVFRRGEADEESREPGARGLPPQGEGEETPGKPGMEFLDINVTKNSSLLPHANHSPFYWRILKKTILFSGFKNP
jgi:hypothetical protein